MFALEPQDLDLLGPAIPQRTLSDGFFAATVGAAKHKPEAAGWLRLCQAAGANPCRVLEYWHEDCARWSAATFAAHFTQFDQGWQDVEEALADFERLENWLDAHEPPQWMAWFQPDGKPVSQYVEGGGFEADLRRILTTLRTLAKKGETRVRFLHEEA
jgi:hypothetical protein